MHIIQTARGKVKVTLGFIRGWLGLGYTRQMGERVGKDGDTERERGDMLGERERIGSESPVNQNRKSTLNVFVIKIFIKFIKIKLF